MMRIASQPREALAELNEARRPARKQISPGPEPMPFSVCENCLCMGIIRRQRQDSAELSTQRSTENVRAASSLLYRSDTPTSPMPNAATSRYAPRRCLRKCFPVARTCHSSQVPYASAALDESHPARCRADPTVRHSSTGDSPSG